MSQRRKEHSDKTPKYRFHLGITEFKKLKWTSVVKRVDYRTLCNMYKIYHRKAPQYLCHSGFINESHSHKTRYNAMAFSVPTVRSNGKVSFNYSGIVLWNNLPLQVKQCQDLQQFLKTCKSHLGNMVKEEKDDFVSY